MDENASSFEPEILDRLRNAIRISGLTADLSELEPGEFSIAVTNRLAQTTIRILADIDPVASRFLSEELRALARADEYDLLIRDLGYTYFHVVQFLYEYAKHYIQRETPITFTSSLGSTFTIPYVGYFCAGMGRGGGGIEVAPEEVVISLISIVTTALSPESDRNNISLIAQELGPLVLSKIFSKQFFQFEVLPEDTDQIRITLRFADRDHVEECLKPFGLGDDIGTFFLNSALHVQGIVLLFWDTLVRDPEENISTEVLIEDRDKQAQENIKSTCACTWTVAWKPDLQLNRLSCEREVISQTAIVYDALHHKDLQYSLERTNALELQMQRKELEAELQTAHDLQMALMPKENPKIKGIDAAGLCVPANHVGGDFFKFLVLSPTRVGGVLADVTGHSMEAAVPLLVFNGILVSQFEVGGLLEELTSRLNRSLCRILPERTLICFQFLELNPFTRNLRLVNCGCPYPFHYSASSRNISEIQLPAYPLGVRFDTEYQVHEMQLQPGDRLIFCSDGIAEAGKEDGDQFGFDQTMETVRKACVEDLSAEATIDLVLDTVNGFKGDAPQSDDMTCVVVRVEDGKG